MRAAGLPQESHSKLARYGLDSSASSSSSSGRQSVSSERVSLAAILEADPAARISALSEEDLAIHLASEQAGAGFRACAEAHRSQRCSARA